MLYLQPSNDGGDDHYDLYWQRSPLAHVKKAKTPTLIIHGAADPRVPIGQSQEMYTALKWKGVPVEFVSYPREGHEVAEKAHQRDFMDRVLAWFDKYLKGADTSTKRSQKVPSLDRANGAVATFGLAGSGDPKLRSTVTPTLARLARLISKHSSGWLTSGMMERHG